MNTPVADFVRAYAGSGVSRLHMPGHKGQPFLGCEALDITEVQGADALFEAAGILRERAPACASGPCCVWPSPAALPGRTG